MKVCTGYTLMFSVLWKDVESRIWDLIYTCDALDKTSMIEVAYTENDSAVLCWHGIKSVSKAKELAKEAWKIFPIQESYIELQKEYLTGCYCDIRAHSKIWRPEIAQP